MSRVIRTGLVTEDSVMHRLLLSKGWKEWGKIEISGLIVIRMVMPNGWPLEA